MRQATEPGSRLLSREFLILGASTMAFFAAMGASNPVLPRFVDDELGGSEAVVGFVLGSMAIASLLSRPLFGRLGDRRGARLLMIVGTLIGAVAFALLAIVGSIPGAIGARLPMGAAQAAVMTGSTTLAIDLAPVERRGEAASYILVAFHFGLGLGPILGEAVLGEGDFDRVWLVLCALCILGTGAALALPKRSGDQASAPGSLLHPRGVVPGIVIGFAMMAFIGFSVFVPLYAEEIGVDKVGPVFLVASVSVAVVRITLGKVPDRLGPIRATALALVAIAFGSALLAAWQAAGGLYVGAIVLAGGGALVMPAMVPAAIDDVPPNRRSSAMATFTMFIDIAVAVTGPLFGLVVAGAGYRSAFLASIGTTAIAAVVLRFVLAPQWYARR